MVLVRLASTLNADGVNVVSVNWLTPAAAPTGGGRGEGEVPDASRLWDCRAKSPHCDVLGGGVGAERKRRTSKVTDPACTWNLSVLGGLFPRCLVSSRSACSVNAMSSIRLLLSAVVFTGVS